MFQLRDILYMHSKQLTVSFAMENLDEKTVELLGIEVDYSKFLDEPLKMCNKCQRNLSISLFSKKKKSKTGGVIYQPKCKKCVSAYKKNYDVVNKLKRKEDRIKSAAADRITKQIYYEKNKSAIKAYAKKYQMNNREKINANRRAYYKKNPDRRLASYCRRRVKKLLEGECQIPDYLGCDRNFLLEWFEFQLGFSHDMTFDNQGSYWHIDHVIPCAKWDLTKEEHRKKCFHWTNLSPLPAYENISKHDSIDLELINEQNKEIEQFSKLKNEEYCKLILLN